MLYMDALDLARRRLNDYVDRYSVDKVLADLDRQHYYVLVDSENIKRSRGVIWRAMNGNVTILTTEKEDKVPEEAYTLYANGHWY